MVGASWTTDAPFRETAEAIEAARRRAYSPSRWRRPRFTRLRGESARVLCLAHVTNTMGQAGQDFEKGEADGTAERWRCCGDRQSC